LIALRPSIKEAQGGCTTSRPAPNGIGDAECTASRTPICDDAGRLDDANGIGDAECTASRTPICDDAGRLDDANGIGDAECTASRTPICDDAGRLDDANGGMTVGGDRPGPGPGAMDIPAIMARIPHRYPMLLVDRILEFEPGRRIVGLKNVTMNEPFFQGHFPGYPIMPGVMVVEAMVQVGGVLASFMPGAEGHTAFFAAIERCRFRRPVRPGDTLITEVTLLRLRPRIGQMQATARVDGAIVAEGVFTYSMGRLENPGAAVPVEHASEQREPVRRGGR
jgi:3-hydroxyacyl-[acyl-carrier-protein] dehydratase